VDLAQAPVLDPTAFDETREFLGDEAEELIRGLVESFRGRMPEMLQSLRRAIASGERRQLEMVAHTLKGLSGTLGARRVQALCQSLETRATQASPSDLTPMLDRLEEECARANTALSAAHPQAVAGAGDP
jgi:HPt (histidine-containing phosphotransfer) domain-containing protein